MATFTITTEKRIDTLSGKAGGDTYTINGGTLIIDQDSRYGLNQSTTVGPLGAITISATLGGKCLIDGRYTRIIPFDSGSGNVPAAGTVISQGAVTGKLIGVWTAINVAPTAAGAAMPASGWIKIKEASQVPGFSAGALTGIGANATGADKAGWIEVVADESKTATVPRLGSFEIKGDWFEVGTTTGTNTDTYQLPTNGNATASGSYLPGVFVHNGEAGDTDANYEFYPSVGALTGANCIATDAVRGKVCWITNAGVLRFGYDGTNTVGYTPPSGRKIRIGNVILHNCTTAARATNALPNTTLGTRYDFTTTGGGAISIDKAMCAWYLSMSKASSVLFTYMAVFEQFYLNQIGTTPVIQHSGTGSAASAVFSSVIVPLGYTGILVEDCVFGHVGGGGSVSCIDITDSIGVVIRRNKTIFHTSYLVGQYSLVMLRVAGATVDQLTFGNGPIRCEYVSDAVITDSCYYARTGSALSRGGDLFFITNGTKRVLCNGVSFADSDSYPSGEIMYAGGYGAEDIELRNCGSVGSPLDMGATAELTNINPSALKNIKVRRAWLTNIPSSMVLSAGNGSSYGVNYENVFTSTYTSAIYQIVAPRTRWRGIVHTAVQLLGSNMCPGAYWHDYFVSDTQGRFRIEMHEPDAALASFVTLENGAAYTGSGGLYMPTIGMRATLEMDYTVLGHTGFHNTAPAMGGGTIGNYTLEYQIDKADGNGWNGTWATLSAANLSAETGIDPALGVKLKVRITTTTTNTAAITSLLIYTTRTTTQYLYPLEMATVTVSGLVSGSVVNARKVSDRTVLFTGTESAGSVSFQTDYAGAISIDAKRASSAPFYKPWHGLVTTVLGETSSITALQQLD